MIKYNNTITEKELRLSGASGTPAPASSESAQAQQEKLELVRSYLSSLPPSEAVAELLSSAALKESLGDSYVYMLNYYRSQI